MTKKEFEQRMFEDNAFWAKVTRVKHNLTVKELAKKAGVTTQTVYNVEEGRSINGKVLTCLLDLEGAFTDSKNTEWR